MAETNETEIKIDVAVDEHGMVTASALVEFPGYTPHRGHGHTVMGALEALLEAVSAPTRSKKTALRAVMRLVQHEVRKEMLRRKKAR
jgi:hypothetical protein